MSCGSAVIDKPAPSFVKRALHNGEFVEVKSEDYLGNTFVCPTEIIEFDKNLELFEERDCQILGVSVDSEYSHMAWTKRARNEGGIGEIRFPLLSDLDKSMSADFGVLCDGEVAFRGLFLIDPRGNVRSFQVNGLAVGRNIEEVLRLLDCFKFVDEHKKVCPVGWKKGDEGMTADEEGLLEFMSDFGDDEVEATE